VTAIGPTAPPAGPRPPTQAEQAQTAAKQLEAFFLRQLLSESRPQGGGLGDGGFATDTFKQMLDEALADKMSSGRGMGMASLFATQLGGDGAQPAARTMAPPPAILQVPPTSHAHGEPLSGPAGSSFRLPVIGRATSGYGDRVDPIHHTKVRHAGFDLAAPTGTRVGAAAAGEVVHAGPAGTYGNLVTVRHVGGFETRYAHLSEIRVAKGDQVTEGQDVGAVGSTGHSTGPHLHFEIRKDGKALDPAPYLPLHGLKNRANR
jgi:murein DD-endopeptidase MepM/ murein hydrolase activator NlpD